MKRQNILITGASSGLGKGMSFEFAKQGYNLALCARRIGNLETLKEELLRVNPNIQVFIRTLDVTIANEVFDVFRAFEADFKSINGTLDRVIVNAGMGKGASIGKGFADQNMQTAVTNFCGALSQMEAAMEIFRAQNHGHLVTISSISAFRGFPRAMNVYAATKAGLRSLSEGLRADVLNKPITISSVYPGFIQSEMTDAIGKPPPFMVSLEKGSKQLVKAINKEAAHSYVPFMPWFYFRQCMRFMTLKMLRNF